ncbi:hypothetical protein GCM10020001_036140 [Nonomuraea salmonea]
MLRTLVGQGGTIEQAALMQRLVSMSDEERERLIDDFWTDVSAGLDASPSSSTACAPSAPHLPDDPTAIQLEAWIELGDLVGDPDFRQAVRTYLQDAYHTPSGRQMTTTPRTGVHPHHRHGDHGGPAGRPPRGPPAGRPPG